MVASGELGTEDVAGRGATDPWPGALPLPLSRALDGVCTGEEVGAAGSGRVACVVCEVELCCWILFGFSGRPALLG